MPKSNSVSVDTIAGAANFQDLPWGPLNEPMKALWKKSDEFLLELEWIGYQMNTEKIIIDHFQHPTFQTFRLLSPFLPPGKTPGHPSRCHDVPSFWDELSKVFPLPLGVVDGIASKRRFFTGKHGETMGKSTVSPWKCGASPTGDQAWMFQIFKTWLWKHRIFKMNVRIKTVFLKSGEIWWSGLLCRLV